MDGSGNVDRGVVREYIKLLGPTAFAAVPKI